MPELPEVEPIARGLARCVSGDVIESVWLGQKPEPLKSPAREIAAVLERSRIVTVRRMGKHIVFDLELDSAQRAPSPAKGPELRRKHQATSAKAHRIVAQPRSEAEEGVRPSQTSQW